MSTKASMLYFNLLFEISGFLGISFFFFNFPCDIMSLHCLHGWGTVPLFGEEETSRYGSDLQDQWTITPFEEKEN